MNLSTIKTGLKISLFLAFCSVATPASAQDTVLTPGFKGKLDSIHSEILNQKRYIQVFTPRTQNPNTNDKYDVLYVLDGGNWNTGFITQVQSFIEGQGDMPPTIIVSIMGIDRNVELTPTHLDNWKGSGGAEKFLGFIKNELIPYINTRYPSNGDNTLWGHSLSGMFAVYAMLNEPTAFKSYIAIDPSIWWDNSLVAKMAPEKISGLEDKSVSLFIAGRDSESVKDMKIDTIETVLKQIAPANLKWKIVPYPGESHSSVRMKGTYDGLKFTYAGVTGNIEFHPMGGIISKSKPYKVWYFEDTTGVHYTTDGTVPTNSSPHALKQITLSDTAKVTFKRFTNRPFYDKTVTGEFSNEKPPQPVAKSKKFKPGGWSYTFYEGNWDAWPDLKKETVVKKGIADKDFDIDNLPRKNNFALEMSGFVEIKEDGYYIFLFEADKNSKLYLGNKLLINWDGNYLRRAFSYMIPLTKGFYPVRVEYLHKNPDFKLRMAYVTPSGMNGPDANPIPFELQYRTE